MRCQGLGCRCFTISTITGVSRMEARLAVETTPEAAVTGEMLAVPGGRFCYRVEHRVREGRCPLHDHGPRLVELPAFHLDRAPVTNAASASYLHATGYRPREPRNFLRHWTEAGGDPARAACPLALAWLPVVWITPQEAAAFAAWAGKRLPADEEWQWAAQGPEGRIWPWGDRFDPNRCNHDTAGPSPVGEFPGGAGPFGHLDLAGNVWEWIAPVLDDGWHRWCFARGGSYYLPRGSYWYVDGGAQRNDHHARVHLLGAALNRSATVGFRCARDGSATAGSATVGATTAGSAGNGRS
jgi:formylglycine-generating enzyme required for sulfatase activity